ncbi:hypothetical protein BaRGS_00025640 [Batillaria attramentaria]|uniref:Uncharacterized protein n=1 Tax=Batillaria attramentaria TaxID=370345 RepID=A0ABD0K720_9CAEN
MSLTFSLEPILRVGRIPVHGETRHAASAFHAPASLTTCRDNVTMIHQRKHTQKSVQMTQPLEHPPCSADVILLLMPEAGSAAVQSH